MKISAPDGGANKKLKMLVIVPPAWTHEDSPNYIKTLLGTISKAMGEYVSSYDIVTSFEEYQALPYMKRTSYDVLAP